MAENLVDVNMSSANESSSPNGETLLKEEYWACFATPILFWLFASLTITMGYYGVKSTVIGPNYSHLIGANSVFVNHIEVSAHQKGPSLYTFSAPPALGCRSIWSENHTMLLEHDHHQEYLLWLNKGSKLYVSCMMQSAGFYSILLTVAKGYSRRRKWFQSRTVLHSVQAWKEVHSEGGNLEYEASKDGEYFVTVQNLNQSPLTIELQLKINATIYNTELADTKCFLGPKNCKVSLPFFKNHYVLLATDISELLVLSFVYTQPAIVVWGIILIERARKPRWVLTEKNIDVSATWEIKLSYGARWSSYLAVLAAVLLSVSGLLKALSMLGETSQEQSHYEGASAEEGMHSPLLSSKDEKPEYQLNESTDDESIHNFCSENVLNVQLCVVCLDAPKTVFFIPCGHAATCLACAKRLRHREMGFCPLCRVKIEKIGRIFK